MSQFQYIRRGNQECFISSRMVFELFQNILVFLLQFLYNFVIVVACNSSIKAIFVCHTNFLFDFSSFFYQSFLLSLGIAFFLFVCLFQDLDKVEHYIFRYRYFLKNRLNLLFKMVFSFVYRVASMTSDIVDAFLRIRAEFLTTCLTVDDTFENKLFFIVLSSSFI